MDFGYKITIPMEGETEARNRRCYACQNISDEYGCVKQDDTVEIRG